jgi:surfeit locus 1 family protein
MSVSRRSLALQGVAAGLLFAALVGLGLWQLRRLEWKEALIARIETRIRAAPTDLPPQRDWARLAPDDYEYLRVGLRGRLDPTREALLFSAPPKGAGDEPGYYVLSPFVLASGGAVLVNRGFAPQSRRDDPARRRTPAEDDIEIVGALRAPQSRNAFTPADDPAKGVWYTRDPEKMAASLGLADAAPFVLDQEPGDGPAPDGLFRARLEAAEIPNSHFAYAVTWFTLAFVLAVMFAIYASGAIRRGRSVSSE